MMMVSNTGGQVLHLPRSSHINRGGLAAKCNRVHRRLWLDAPCPDRLDT
jgi:hypothetical protein